MTGVPESQTTHADGRAPARLFELDSARYEVWALVALALGIRLLFAFITKLDSDEPQHLHVAWAWSRGLVQYRDIFDNHFPLLHLLFAPLMRFMPESSAVFFAMRMAIAPIAMGCSWLLYVLGRAHLGRRTAAIAAITFSVMPPWLPESVEFRNDVLWVFLWLLTIVLIAGRRGPFYIAAGFAAGLCLLASVKALPLFLAHALAIIANRQAISPKAFVRFALGAAIPLATITTAMYALGALDEMVHATLLFNFSMPLDLSRRVTGVVAFAIAGPILAWWSPRVMPDGSPLTRHLMLFALWFAIVLLCFWPILTERDLLPLVPLAALALANLRIARSAPVVVVIAATLLSAAYARLWRPPEKFRQAFVDAAVNVTAPGDYVFDLKGNSVFRRRPVYYIYDTVGRALISNGTIPDHGPEQLVARGCCAAIGDVTHIPPRTREFLNHHFIDLGAMRVCGTTPAGGAFTIAVPQTYAVVAEDPSAIAIDGTPYKGPRFLSAGRHTISGPTSDQAVVVWWRAVEGNRLKEKEQ